MYKFLTNKVFNHFNLLLILKLLYFLIYIFLLLHIQIYFKFLTILL